MQLSDTFPDIIFMSFGLPEVQKQFEEEMKKRNIIHRELKFYQVTIPLDDKYDETINFLKRNTMKNYWKDRNPLFMDGGKIMGIDVKQMAIKQFEKATGYKVMDWRKTDWHNDVASPLLYTLLLPLFYQDQSGRCETQQEKDNMEKLRTYESKGYVNDKESWWIDINKKLEEEGKGVPDE